MEESAKTQASEGEKNDDSKQSNSNTWEQETTNNSPDKRESVDYCSRVETMSDLSVFSDSENQYLSSSATSTLKSDLSGFRDQGRRWGAMKNQDAVATLDSFLMDVTRNLEKAKEEEKTRMKSEKIHSKENISVPKVAAPLMRAWSSLSNLGNDENQRTHLDEELSQSYDDLKFIPVDDISDSSVVPDSAPPILYREKKKKGLLSQSSDQPETYGIAHLNQLCTLIEQFENLKSQNTKLTNQVSNLSKEKNTDLRKASSVKKFTSDTFQPLSLPKKNDFDFTESKGRPKKVPKSAKFKGTRQHKEKSKFKSRYPALSLPFVLAARSVDNLKFSSSQNLYKEKAKPKKAEKYSRDDLEIGKSVTGENWRQSSVKSTTAKEPNEVKIIMVDDLGTANQNTNEKEISVPIAEQTVSPNENTTKIVDVYMEKSPVENQSSTAAVTTTPKPINKKAFPVKQISPVKRKPEEQQSYRNVKKMTEWGALEQAFPSSHNIETSEDLLNHLDSVFNKHRPGKKSTHPSFKKAQWFATKKEKSNSSDIYLPNTEMQGFGSTLFAAQAMANHLTLSLSLGDLKALSTTHMHDDNQNIPGAQTIHIP